MSADEGSGRILESEIEEEEEVELLVATVMTSSERGRSSQMDGWTNGQGSNAF